MFRAKVQQINEKGHNKIKKVYSSFLVMLQPHLYIQLWFLQQAKLHLIASIDAFDSKQSYV